MIKPFLILLIILLPSFVLQEARCHCRDDDLDRSTRELYLLNSYFNTVRARNDLRDLEDDLEERLGEDVDIDTSELDRNILNLQHIYLEGDY